MKKENKLISFLQIYGIILVIIGHANMTWDIDNPLQIFRRWIYGFHMPLFIFISGYLLQYALQEKGKSIRNLVSTNYWGFICQKAKRLLLPYAFISSIVFLPKVCLSHYAKHPIEGSFSAWIHMLVYPWDNVICIYWFLPTLFIITLVGVLVFCLYRQKGGLKRSCLVITGLILLIIYNPFRGILLFNLEGVVHYLPYFILGIYYSLFQKSIDNVLLLKSKSTLIITFSISLLLLLYNTPNPPYTSTIPHIYLYHLILVIKSINGIIMSISLGYLYIEKKWTFLDSLNGSSSAIYLFSWFPQVIFQILLPKFIPISWQAATLLAVVTGIYIPFLVYKVLLFVKRKNKYGKYLALLLGQ